MILNWAPHVISGLIISVALFLGGLFILKSPAKKRIPSIMLFKISYILAGCYFLLYVFANLFLNEFLCQLYIIFLIFGSICFIMGINYNIKESYFSIHLIPLFVLGTLIFLYAFQPGNTIETYIYGFYSIDWIGSLEVLGFLQELIFFGIFLVWSFYIRATTPFIIKSEVNVIFYSIIGSFIFAVVSYIIQFWNPALIFLSDIATIIGLLIFSIMIRKEPRIFFILPFIPYKITVRDHEGFSLFEYNWTKSSINERVFIGFQESIQQMHEAIIEAGGSLDINITNGIFLFQESKYLLVGFVVSRSSKFLRELIKLFIAEFEDTFEDLLKESCKDPNKYQSVQSLFEKYFSIFPSRIINDEKHEVFFSKPHMKVPREIEEKLLQTMDAEDIEAIKCDIQRSTDDVSSDYLDLYKELKEEVDSIPPKEKEERKKRISFSNSIYRIRTIGSPKRI